MYYTPCSRHSTHPFSCQLQNAKHAPAIRLSGQCMGDAPPYTGSSHQALSPRQICTNLWGCRNKQPENAHLRTEKQTKAGLVGWSNKEHTHARSDQLPTSLSPMLLLWFFHLFPTQLGFPTELHPLVNTIDVQPLLPFRHLQPFPTFFLHPIPLSWPFCA